MARTGSGKTLAYLVPLVHRLSSNRSRLDGPRALVLCPSRELALQILKTGKDLARAIKGGGEVEHRLRWTMIIGGEAMDKQFEAMTSKPDM
jgi:ATP-dependent RNA helicase DDX54/DBP10